MTTIDNDGVSLASGRAPGAYMRAKYASDVEAALDCIGAPTIGIGHSLGGVSLAAVGSARHPNLSAVYLLDAPLFPAVDGQSRSAGIFQAQLAMLHEFQPSNRPIDDYVARISAAPSPTGGTMGQAMVPQQLRGRAEHGER